MKNESLKLFLSDEYREYTQRQAQDMVLGVYSYLRSLGFDFSEQDEEKRADVAVEIRGEHSNFTALTDSKSIVLNAGCVCFDILNGDESLLHYAIQGFRVHEMGHVLFSDFVELAGWVNAFDEKKWYPRVPDATFDEFSEIMGNLVHRAAFIEIAKDLCNIIEDGYIEKEVVALYPGIAKTQLATLNDVVMEWDLAQDGALQKEDDFCEFRKNLLLYAKQNIHPVWKDFVSDETIQVFELCKPWVDKAIRCRNPRERFALCNEVIAISFPVYQSFFSDEENQNSSFGEENQNAGNGSGKSGNSKSSKSSGCGSKSTQSIGGNNQSAECGNTGDSSSQSGNSESGSSSGNGKNESADSTSGTENNESGGKNQNNSKVKQEIVDELRRRNAQNTGKQSRRRSKSLFSGKKMEQNSEVPTQGDAASEESTSDSSKKHLENALSELERIKKEIELNQENEQKESALNKKLDEECPFNVVRLSKVSPEHRSIYSKLSKGLLSVSRSMEKTFKNLIKDEENEDTISGLYMGARFEARNLYHNDGRYFSRKNAPSDECRLAIGLLCDESGSMRAEMIRASIQAGIIIEDLCKRLDLPCIIGGYTSESYFSYVEPESTDKNDKFRLCSMRSRLGTPTGKAMEYMLSRLEKVDCRKKLLIVSTDGCSDEGKNYIHSVLKVAKKKNVLVIGAGIGKSRQYIQEEFNGNYLDVSDVTKMPLMLARIIKRNLF